MLKYIHHIPRTPERPYIPVYDNERSESIWFEMMKHTTKYCLIYYIRKSVLCGIQERDRDFT